MKKPKLSSILKEEIELQSIKGKNSHKVAVVVLGIVVVVLIVMIAKAYFIKSNIVGSDESKTPEQKIESQPEIKDDTTQENSAQKKADTSATKKTEPDKKPVATPEYTTYTVQKGDTLSEIANVNGMTSKQLMKYNGIASPESIKPGQKIKIPQ